MVALLGLATFFATHTQVIPSGAKISCAFNPQRIAKILPDLGKAMDLKLSVDSALADDTVMLGVNDADSKDLLDRIAAVLSAKWVPDDKGFNLIPDKEKLRNAQSKEARDRADEIQRSIADMAAKLGPGAYEESAICNLLSMIGPKALADLPLGTRHVFAVRPNARQDSLPAESDETIKKLVDNEWQRQVGENPNLTQEPKPLAMKSLLALQVSHDKIQAKLMVGTTMDRLVPNRTIDVIVHRPIHAPSPTGDPIIIDPVSREFFTRAFHISSSGVPLSSSAVSASTTRANAPQVTFEASSAYSVQENPRISKELRQWLLDPLGLDPFWIATKPLEQAAELGRANLVAYMPDYGFGPLAKSLATEKMDVDGFLHTAMPAAGFDVTESSGWLMVSAKEPNYAIRSHIGRSALGKFIGSFGDTGMLSLESIADYALAQATPMQYENLDDLYVSALNSQARTNASNALTEPWIARIYATLSDRQRAALGGKRQLGWRDLTPDQQQWAEFAFYNSVFDPQLSESKSPTIFTPNIMLFGAGADRTELLPNGIADTLVFTMSAEQQPAFWATDSRSGVSAFVTAGRLASERYQRERPDLAFLGTMPNFDSFLPALNQTVRLNLEVTTIPLQNVSYGLAFGRPLSGDVIAADAQSLGYEDLPSAFRSDVDSKLKGMEEALPNMNFGPRKQKTPPP